MNRKLDPKRLGLHHSTQIYETGKGSYLLRMDRKSRIIMKDGLNILKKANQIIEVHSDAKVEVVTNAPICSKTKRFLSDEGIIIRSVSDWTDFED